MSRNYISEKNIIIAESPKMAAYIAAALGGIHDSENDSVIRYEEIDKKKARINAIAKNFFFHTKLNGTSTAVTWLSSNYLKSRRQLGKITSWEALPIFTNDVNYIIEEKSFYRLLEAKNCQTVYFALSPSIEAHIAKDIIRTKIIKSAAFYDIRINNISKKYILAAFNAPMTNVGLNGAVNIAKNRSVVTSCIKNNLTSAVKLLIGQDVPIDQYVLLSLLLLKQREERLSSKKYAVKASININGTWCVASSKLTFSENDARKLIKETLPTEIVSKGFADFGLPTTATFFKLCSEKNQDIKLNAIAKDLYESGLISQPFTMNTHLPSKYTEDEIDSLISLCSEFSTADTPILALGESREILKRMKNPNNTAENLSAIIPYKTKNDIDNIGKVIHKEIAQSIVRAINFNEKRRYEFLAGNISLYARVPSTQVKSSLRPKRKWPVSYDIAEAETYTRYTAFELIEELEKRCIGTPEVYFSLMDTLLAYGLVSFKGSDLRLTLKGSEICGLFSFEPEMITILGKWETVLHTLEKGDSSMFATLLNEVHSTIAKWIDSLSTQTPKTIHELPAMPAEKEHKASSPPPKSKPSPQPLHCPACNNETLTLQSGRFQCTTCGKEYHNTYIYNGYPFMLRTADIKSLISRGKTAVKFAKDKNGDIIAGFIYLNENKDMAYTNKSERFCPYCGKPLYVYDWGFACEECAFNVPFEIHGVKLTSENIQKLLSGEITDMIDGLTFSNGTTISAKLHIDNNGNLKYYRS